jgi:hypothetical protein
MHSGANALMPGAQLRRHHLKRNAALRRMAGPVPEHPQPNFRNAIDRAAVRQRP